MCSLFCMHRCTPVTSITAPLWWVQVSLIILTSTQAVGGGRELMRSHMGPESQGGSGEVGSMACCSQDDIQCLEHMQTFPTYLGFCRRRSAGLFDIAHVTDIVDLKESPIIGWLACLDSPDEWFYQWEKGQGTGNVLHRNGEQDGGGQSNLDDPHLTWEKRIGKRSQLLPEQSDSTAKE